MQLKRLKASSCLVALAVLSAVPVALLAQDAPQPAPKPAPVRTEGVSGDSPSRFDLYIGYAYIGPHGTVEIPTGNGNTFIPYRYDAIKVGGLASGTYFMNKYTGLQIETGVHEWGSEVLGKNTGTRGNNDGFFTVSGGLLFRFPTDTITPFVHGLVGAALVDGPNHNPYTWGPALTAGGGMDLATPLFHHRLGIRLFQADFEYMHADFGPRINYGGRANIDAARLGAGLVIHMGNILPPPQLTVACSANPTSVYPGDPVNLTATVGSQDPKSPSVIYTWSGDGVKGTGANATVDTASLSPGTHTVKCDAKEGKAGKEGVKPWENAAEATTTFTVKEFEPPTISCSVSPTTIKPGDSATITSQGMSPQNRPLTYTYTASSGSVNGSGATATFSSTGAATGPVSITCNVADDKGHNASGSTTVTIEAPPPPPQPKTQALCSINFTTDKTRPTRVDNEAKACLDEVALNLQRSSDAKAVVVGESSAKEKEMMEKAKKSKHKHMKMEDFAGQRAVNTKQYLVQDKGIDASRITVATGSGDDQKVENYLVPAGATFGSDVQGTTPVDESAVKVQMRKPLPERHHSKHMAKKAMKAK